MRYRHFQPVRRNGPLPSLGMFSGRVMHGLLGDSGVFERQAVLCISGCVIETPNGRSGAELLQRHPFPS